MVVSVCGLEIWICGGVCSVIEIVVWLFVSTDRASPCDFFVAKRAERLGKDLGCDWVGRAEAAGFALDSFNAWSLANASDSCAGFMA